ncbi:MAG: extracellular solute-binding protein [Rhodospirillales bacterium]|nr:extracellular solute-binding protein [Rhodospirillales bacterium]
MFPLSRRAALGSLASLPLLVRWNPAKAAPAKFEPKPELVEAAKKEGEMVLYTAAFPEVMQDTITTFNKRFPFVRVRMVRASGGQLITRVQSESAAGKLEADVLDHSDRGQTKAIEDLFLDYAPPNAKDYMPETLVSPKLWPTITAAWAIAWNPEVVKNPPKSWMDLTKPEYGNGQIGQVIAPSGGTTWTRIMFERQVLGEDYWAKQAATKPKLYPSGAPLSDAVVRGEVGIAPLLLNIVYPKMQAGAPIQAVYAPEGIPINPYGSGIPKSARHPNAARLWMDWNLSEEGQADSITAQGNMTSLKTPPINPPLFDPKTEKLWNSNFAQYQSLHDAWLADWNKAYGYRQ